MGFLLWVNMRKTDGRHCHSNRSRRNNTNRRYCIDRKCFESTGWISYLKTITKLLGVLRLIDYETITETLPSKQYTLGFNRFLVGHKLKVQSDLSYTTLDGQKDNITFRLGFDIHF